MRHLTTLLIFLCLACTCYSQDNVLYRVILIGDAGKIDPQQKAVIAAASGHILNSKTSVLYLGDNIYPRGMGLPGTESEETGKTILRSQFEPMRAKGASVFFIPGNHDWDRMGVNGLQKIQQQWSFLESQQDPLLKLVPPNGCPDPVELNLSDKIAIIAFDSEWWLFPHTKVSPGSDCDCKSTEEITAKLKELLYKNRDKYILLASHHPFQSYGRHGGKFSLKDNIFPLTAVNKNLYIPLPIVGSLYPILRKTLVNPEDLKHPLYQAMIREITEAAAGYPNLVYVAGHEHGLQYIQDERTQIVSGSGAKESYVRKGKHSSFASASGGFVLADILPGNNLRVTYYEQNGNDFTASYTDTLGYTNVQQQEELAINNLTGDSTSIAPIPRYNDVSGLHRLMFGENYRKEYATPATVPIIRISEIKGGLKPTRLGGGHQSKSLRLEDKNGKEYVLRSVEKYPEVLLPEEVRQTFAKDLLNDNMSSQHPFSALVVPMIAEAARVPHSNPIIGVVAPDKNLGQYYQTFANTLCLLEEREPAGNSDNTQKMYQKLDDDNDNSFDSALFLRARLVDILLADWDRHEDQWRWADEKTKQGKVYKAVPRDRDLVFYTNQGIVPYFAARRWTLTFLREFKPRIDNINGTFWESRFLNNRFLNQFSLEEYNKIINEFVAAMNDSVLEAALQKLPASNYHLRHDWFLNTLKARRDDLKRAMDHYYYFINKRIDIKVTNKNEWVEITDAPDNSLEIKIHKLSKKGEIEQQLFRKIIDPKVTKEVRIYLSGGDDSVLIKNTNNPVKIRIIGGTGKKVYNAVEGKGNIKVYDKPTDVVFSGASNRFKTHLSPDSANTAYVPVYLYNVIMPLLSIGYNADDGFLLGAGFKYTRQEGFRKKPFASQHTLTAAHSFSTNAFNIRYIGEWTDVIGKTDIVLKGTAKAPNNTQNFFGRGNESKYDDNNAIRFYRSRFNIYEASAALRWGNLTQNVSFGPAFQYYTFDADDNKDRFIISPDVVSSYDSLTLANDKAHVGLVLDYTLDKRNHPVFPAWGTYVNFKLQGFKGVNDFSKSYGQAITEISFYRSLNKRNSIVIANRIGGGATVGSTTFYQSLFLGGHENLLGYRQYRFAGQYSAYDNIELRIRLANVGSYVLPGQFGLLGFFDIGRVWEKNDRSDKWHNGAGGGIYFAPLAKSVIKAVVGYSSEGVYPYITVGMRF